MYDPYLHFSLFLYWPLFLFLLTIYIYIYIYICIILFPKPLSIYLYINIHMWICVCIYEWTINMGLCFHQVRTVCFLKILATTCRIAERKSQAFPFESISRLSVARFMTSSEKSFWVVDGMTSWPWKKGTEWPTTDLVD